VKVSIICLHKIVLNNWIESEAVAKKEAGFIPPPFLFIEKPLSSPLQVLSALQ
jgi:hypothetical protein